MIRARASMSDKGELGDRELVAAALETRIYTAYVAGRAAREVEATLAGNTLALTPLALGLLHFLRQGEKTLAEVSRHMPAPPSTLVPVVDALEQRGLLRRGRDPRDRRRTPLTLTAQGRAALAEVPPLTGYAAILAAMQTMERGKARQLAALLAELVAAMGGDDITRGVSDSVRIGLPSHQGPNAGGQQPRDAHQEREIHRQSEKRET